MVQKTSVKRPVARKTTTKVQKVIENEHKCACGHDCHCGCHHGFWHFLRNLIILLIVFVLGAMSARFFMGPRRMPMTRVEFNENGCVIMDSIKCPKMLEKIQKADADSNGCVTKQEFRKSMREMHKKKGGMHRFNKRMKNEQRHEMNNEKRNVTVETESIRVVEKTNM